MRDGDGGHDVSHKSEHVQHELFLHVKVELLHLQAEVGQEFSRTVSVSRECDGGGEVLCVHVGPHMICFGGERSFERKVLEV